QVAFAPGTGEVGREEVTLGPLSQFISASDIVGPAVLKLDVQGYELEALTGCASLLSCFRYIFVEVSFKSLYHGQVLAAELIEWLADHGFHARSAGNVSYGEDSCIVQFDILFQ